MTAFDLHPAELAYALSYARASGIIGWDEASFMPSKGHAATDWLEEGEAHLLAAGRLTGTDETGLNFTDLMTRTILTFVDPAIVFLAERKTEGGTLRLTVHAKDADFIGLTRSASGRFEVTRYGDITAAAAACAGFLGAVMRPTPRETRLEADRAAFLALRTAGAEGRRDEAITELTAMGAEPDEAVAAVTAMAAPDVGGLMSVLYCANGKAQEADTMTVLTQSEAGTWLLVQPAGPDGPMILERSSAAALTARVSVSVAARLHTAGS